MCDLADIARRASRRNTLSSCMRTSTLDSTKNSRCIDLGKLKGFLEPARASEFARRERIWAEGAALRVPPLCWCRSGSGHCARGEQTEMGAHYANMGALPVKQPLLCPLLRTGEHNGLFRSVHAALLA